MVNFARGTLRVIAMVALIYALGLAEMAIVYRFQDIFLADPQGTPFLALGLFGLVFGVAALWWPWTASAGALLDRIGLRVPAQEVRHG